MEKLDTTAARLGLAIRNARKTCRLSRDEAADLLRIMPDELTCYERGTARIPQDILERIITMGYKMMHVRGLEYKYRLQRSIFRKLKETVASAP